VLLEQGRARYLLLPDGTQAGPFDAVIATVPSPAFLEMAPDLPEAYTRLVAGVRYQVALCLVLQLSRPLSHIYWLNISDPESPFVGAIEHTNYIPPEVYGGRHFLYLTNYLAPGHPYLDCSAEELFAHYLPGIRRINPSFRPDWVEALWLFWDPGAQPVVTPYYSQRIPPHRTPVPGLYLANTTQIYPEDRGTNYSVRLGRKIAREIAHE
ncbi:MAG: FAD-dependent oxidoreductase, partial [Chloroflexia bacterium]